MANEERVKLLWDGANSLNAETHTNKLLKSYYINTCRKLARDNIQVPKEKFSASQMCPRCSVFWSENEFSLKLKPQAVAKSGKAKKLIAKFDAAMVTKAKGVLSKKQRRRAKWLKKRVCSTVEIRCENCQHKSLVPLQKPQKKLIEAHQVTETTVEATPIVKSKKKKSKKKDQTAGLKIAATKPKELSTERVKEGTKPGKSVVIVAEKQPKIKQVNESSENKAKVKPVTKTVPVQHSPNLSQTLKAKKKKKYNKNNIKTTPHEPTVISKTQKNNSLLQLAALLKNQGSKSNTQQNRLDSLLD